MAQKRIEVFEENPKRYDEWYDRHHAAFMSEVRAVQRHMQKLPTELRAIEVGLGSGRFARELGIKEGVEPADNLRQMAISRGIEAMEGKGEMLPYADLQFDFVLFATISFLQSPAQAFGEAFRVLKDGGSVIVGFIDHDSTIGQDYRLNRSQNVFYRHAVFYTIDRVEGMLKEAGFRDFEYQQTLFGALDEIDEIQDPKPGHGEGSFVVVRGVKRITNTTKY